MEGRGCVSLAMEFGERHTDKKRFSSLLDYCEMLEAAIDHAEIGFLIADADCNVLKINDAQIKITGQEAMYNLGRNMRDIQIEDHSLSATVMISDTKKPVKIEQHLPNGHSYLVYGNPFFDQVGALKYIICNLIDSTEVHQTKCLLENIQEENARLEDEILKLSHQIEQDSKIIFHSKAMENVIGLCKKVARFDTTALILGESGTGKELIAEYIFEHSPRRKEAFVKINCASIPENLLESEFFGYEGGAFTGANKQGSKGMFEIAHGGTLLLDEIGELPLQLQAKLLRFLQDGTFYRVGGRKPMSADVRIIASTHRHLKEMVAEGLFREDLFYRLSVVPIQIPPLRQRKEDIPILISHFLGKFNQKYQCEKHFSIEVIQLLMKAELQGNVRELQNLVERLLVLSEGNTIGAGEYFSLFHSAEEGASKEQSLKGYLQQYEKMILENYAKQCSTEMEMSQRLQTSQSSISRKLRAYGIDLMQI